MPFGARARVMFRQPFGAHARVMFRQHKLAPQSRGGHRTVNITLSDPCSARRHQAFSVHTPCSRADFISATGCLFPLSTEDTQVNPTPPNFH